MIDEEGVKRVEGFLSELEGSRERLLKEGRDVLIYVRRAMMSVHKGDAESAESDIDGARTIIERLRGIAEGEMKRYILPVESEYVEAKLFYELVFEGKLSMYDEIGVDPRSYLLGLLDMIGECRRSIYDMIREGKVDEAERLFKAADEIYSKVMHLSIYERVVPGIRRKTDVAKVVLDDSRRILAELSLKGPRAGDP